EHALVGPDNGSLIPPARALSGSVSRPDTAAASSGGTADPDEGPPFEVFQYRIEDPASATFHGRDVFAPLAARVHEAGIDDLEAVDGLEPTDSFVDLRFPEPEPVERSGGSEHVVGEVLVVDGFGNAITNLPGELARGRDLAVVNGVAAPVVETFADVEPGRQLVTVGSHGYLECDVREGRGDEAFGLEPGDRIAVEFPRDDGDE
ncbi:MAG: SAM-dependent chlorinase/fluorinase, partial [Haloferacaceae archaeon]